MEWGNNVDDWDVKPREAIGYINYDAYPGFDNLTAEDMKKEVIDNAG